MAIRVTARVLAKLSANCQKSNKFFHCNLTSCGSGRIFSLAAGGRHEVTYRHISGDGADHDTDHDLTRVPLSRQPPDRLLSQSYHYTCAGGEAVRETRLTTLEGGLRVASQDKYGHYCTVGVVIDSGSRYESAYPSGVNHYLEKLGFMSTRDFKSREEIMSMLEKYGGICDCQGSRDTMIYAASFDVKGLPDVIRLLSDAVLRPKLQRHEIEAARQAIAFELEDIELNANQEMMLNEMAHAAAYVDNTLGLPKICPREVILDKIIDKYVLYTYLRNHYVPPRMVVAGVGCDHSELCDLVTHHFLVTPAIWKDDPDLIQLPNRKLWTHDVSSRLLNNKMVDDSRAQYTGGFHKVEKDLSHLRQGPNPLPELIHFVLGCESVSHKDQDFVPICVLNMMMGGGGSFSAGGPGKGMYTRLYTNVLNRYPWMFSATAYNHAYCDTGLFYIHASAQPSRLADVVDVVSQEMNNMCQVNDEVEVERAKKQLQSMLLMNLESRPVIFEDIGRQVLATGQRKPPEYYLQEIGKITSSDIERVVARLMKSKCTVAAYGKVSDLPSYQHIHSLLTASNGGRKPLYFKIFSS